MNGTYPIPIKVLLLRSFSSITAWQPWLSSVLARAERLFSLAEMREEKKKR